MKVKIFKASAMKAVYEINTDEIPNFARILS